MIGPVQYFRRLAIRRVRSLARKAQGEGRWVEALDRWEELRRLDPGNANALIQTANMFNELGRYDLAAQRFSEVAGEPAYVVLAQVGFAGVAERRSDWVGARSAWESALRIMAEQETLGAGKTPHWPLTPAEILVHCAVCRHACDDFSGAERDLFVAFSLDSKVRRTPEAVLLRSRLLARRDVGSAYRLLKASRARFPKDYALLHDLTRLAAMSSSRAEAFEYAAALLALNPNDEATRAFVEGLSLSPLPDRQRLAG